MRLTIVSLIFCFYICSSIINQYNNMAHEKLECLVTIKGTEAVTTTRAEIRGGMTTPYIEVKMADCDTHELLCELLDYYGEEELIRIIKAINE